jgi:hypothetical protein
MSKTNVLTLALTFALGFIAAEAIERLSASSAHAQAGQRVWRECFSTSVWNQSGRRVNGGDLPEMVRVPAGWTPVGGGSHGDYGMVVLCR